MQRIKETDTEELARVGRELKEMEAGTFELAPDDPRRRFHVPDGAWEFVKASPVTEDEKAEADAMIQAIIGDQHSPGKKKTANLAGKKLIK